MVRASGPVAAQGGFTYIGLMLVLALLAAGLAAASVVWHTATRRAQEAELLFIGGEFKRAIASYYDGAPGAVKQLPKRLEDLLRDARYPTVRRHLRKIYIDPIAGRAEWGLVATPAGITGVYSLSEREPFKNRAASSMQSPRPGAVAASAARRATKYSDWKFVAAFEQPPAMAPGAPAAAPQPAAEVPRPGVAGQAVSPAVQPLPPAGLSAR